MTWQETAAKKVAERDTHFFKEWLIPDDKLPTEDDVLDFPVKSGYLTSEEIEITESTAREICAKIVAKEWTSYQVTKAFCHRTSIAQQLTNCLTEVFFDEGLAQAKELDDYYEKTGKLKGPFHGLPISLKDNINMVGKATTLGFVGWCNDPEGGFSFDSEIVKLLRELGAVFYCKTNLPVSMMMGETVNNVYGRTVSPCNRWLSCGGSSGGAGAHVALKGAPIAVGSDIGGSIRLPSAFNHVYGIRPTFGRYPLQGCRSALPGQESIHSVNGPLCHDLDSLEFFMKTLADADPSRFDPNVIFQPWTPVTLPKKLNFAVLYQDGQCLPTPPITRGLKTVVAALKKAGHEVIEWDPAEYLKITAMAFKLFSQDGAKHIMKYINASGEPLFPGMKMIVGTSDGVSANELWDIQNQRTALCKQFLDRWIATASQTSDGRPIDAIISPVSPWPGCPHGKLGRSIGYTVVYNVLDYSSGVIPVGRVDPKIDVDPTYKPRNDIEKEIWSNYDAEKSKGGSISVQITGRHGQDEKVVALMELIFSYLKQ